MIANANARDQPAATRMREHLQRRAAEPLVVALGQQAHGHPLVTEARAVEAGQPPAAATEVDLAAHGQPAWRRASASVVAAMPRPW